MAFMSICSFRNYLILFEKKLFCVTSIKKVNSHTHLLIHFSMHLLFAIMSMFTSILPPYMMQKLGLQFSSVRQLNYQRGHKLCVSCAQ